MPGQGANAHRGYHRHLRICREGSTWGQFPDPHTWWTIPILGDGYKVRAKRPKWRAPVNWGGYRRKVSIDHQEIVEGDMTILFFPHYTEIMLQAALLRNGALNDDLYSYYAQYYAPHLALDHQGLVCESLAISADGNSGEFTGRYTWVGKEEIENETLAATDFDYDDLEASPYMFNHASIEAPDDTVITDVEKFDLTINNNVARGPFKGNPGLLQYAYAGRREITVTLTELADRQNFFDAKEGGTALSFEAIFTHPDGETLTITLPALDCDEDNEDAEAEAKATATPSLVARTDDNGDDITWSETTETSTETQTGTSA